MCVCVCVCVYVCAPMGERAQTRPGPEARRIWPLKRRVTGVAALLRSNNPALAFFFPVLLLSAADSAVELFVGFQSASMSLPIPESLGKALDFKTQRE